MTFWWLLWWFLVANSSLEVSPSKAPEPRWARPYRGHASGRALGPVATHLLWQKDVWKTASDWYETDMELIWKLIWNWHEISCQPQSTSCFCVVFAFELHLRSCKLPQQSWIPCHGPFGPSRGSHLRTDRRATRCPEISRAKCSPKWVRLEENRGSQRQNHGKPSSCQVTICHLHRHSPASTFGQGRHSIGSAIQQRIFPAGRRCCTGSDVGPARLMRWQRTTPKMSRSSLVCMIIARFLLHKDVLSHRNCDHVATCQISKKSRMALSFLAFSCLIINILLLFSRLDFFQTPRHTSSCRWVISSSSCRASTQLTAAAAEVHAGPRQTSRAGPVRKVCRAVAQALPGGSLTKTFCLVIFWCLEFADFWEDPIFDFPFFGSSVTFCPTGFNHVLNGLRRASWLCFDGTRLWDFSRTTCGALQANAAVVLPVLQPIIVTIATSH